MSKQLILNIQQPVSNTFDNYVLPNDSVASSQIVTTLKHTARGDATPNSMSDESKNSSIFLWGSAGRGKTHLLQACACEARNNGRDSIYLPLLDLGLESFEILQSLEQYSIICIDDLNIIAGDDRWERPLFHLYNQAQITQATLVFAANNSPRNLGISRPELTTRLGWGVVYQLAGPDEAEKKEAIQRKATALGFDLSDDVVNYMLNHYHRDNHRLFALLNQLDELSLADQRKITVPFLKQIFAEEL